MARQSLLLLFAMAAGCSGPAPQQPAAAVTLRTLDPADFHDVLARHGGRVALVDFWATWCSPCVEWFPHTVELQRRLAGRGLSVITVSMDDSDQTAAVQDFLQRQQATSENFINRDGAGSQSFDEYQIPSGLPHLKLYDRRGKLRKTFAAGASPVDARQIQRAVEELLDEQT